jgi:hypothetical protein
VAARLGLRRFWFFGERKEKDLPQRSQRKAHGGHGEMGVSVAEWVMVGKASPLKG